MLEKEHIQTAFPVTEIGQMLQNYGNCESYRFPSGDTVTVFPTCPIPVSFFDKQNWKKVTGMGITRDAVYTVDSLVDGTNPMIVVKSPERVFTQDERLLKNGHIWYGGPKTFEKKVRIDGNSIVEEQILWEAVILQELIRNGMRAEIPYAVIEDKNGQRELVVNRIRVPIGYVPVTEHSQSMKKIAEIGLHPGDIGGHNVLTDEEGRRWLIDVNRWTWPPHTDNFRSRLLQVVRESGKK